LLDPFPLLDPLPFPVVGEELIDGGLDVEGAADGASVEGAADGACDP